MSGRVTRILKFYRPDYGEGIEDADPFEFNTLSPNDLEYAAEKYAEYYHAHRDGWEASWPIEFHIADEQGNFLGVYVVDRRSEPVFEASKKKLQR